MGVDENSCTETFYRSSSKSNRPMAQKSNMMKKRKENLLRRSGWNKSKKLCDNSGSANFIQHPSIFENLSERNQIDRASRIPHLHKHLKYLLMGWEVKMLRLHLRDAIIEDRGRMQDRA
jgi:hypothetical protein